MALPKAVQQQDDASDQALRDFVGEEAELDPGIQVEAPEQGASAENRDPPASEAEVTPRPPTPETTVPSDVEELRRQLDYEKHRNDSLQGRLDSQLRPMAETVRDLRAQLAAMEKKMQDRETAAPTTPAHLRHLRPEELENLDQASLEMQSRVARGVAEDITQSVSQRIETQKAELDQRLQALEGQRVEQEMQAFWGKVETQFPGARQINDDPRWVEFLSSVDPMSGRSRRDIGEAAIYLGDVRRVVDLLQDFSAATGRPTPTGSPAPAPVTPAPVRRPDVVRATPQAPAQPATMVIRESHIKKFYDDWARGKFTGREQEADKIAAAIDAAVAEGRIAPG